MGEQDKAETPAGSMPAVESTLPKVPAEWPGAFGVYKYSKQAVRLNLETLILIWLLTTIVTVIFDYILKGFGGLVSLAVDGLTGSAFVLTYLAGVRGQRLTTGDAFNKAMNFWLRMIGLILLLGVSYVISILLLVIPFFFVFPRLSLATYFLIDHDMGVMEAYKASWEATKGNAGKIYGIVGATILMVLLAFTIIGIPFFIYFVIMYGAAYAVLYEFLGKSVKPPAVAEPPTA